MKKKLETDMAATYSRSIRGWFFNKYQDFYNSELYVQLSYLQMRWFNFIFYSMFKMEPGITYNVRPNITFMRVGVANIDTKIPAPDSDTTKAESEMWTLNRLSTLIKTLNHTKVLIRNIKKLPFLLFKL